MKIFHREFYLQDTVAVAKKLIGAYIFHVCKGQVLSGRIVETEAYVGSIDRACHAFGYKKTERTQVMFLPGGVAYIYLIYGMHYCMNVVTEQEGEPCAVLIRGLLADQGKDAIAYHRFQKSYEQLTAYQKKNLLNGPGKVCQGLAIDKGLNTWDITQGDFYIGEKEQEQLAEIGVGKRINIDYAGEDADRLWRFFEIAK